MQLTKTIAPDDFIRGLESWRWLGIAGKTPLLTSLFGDVILQDAAGWWFLDTLEGTLTCRWGSRDEVLAALKSDEGQDQYLLAGLAFAADRREMVLGRAEVYAFTVPPVLGGAIDIANVTISDFVVAVNLAGQLHEQVKDLPPGSKISGFTIDD